MATQFLTCPLLHRLWRSFRLRSAGLVTIRPNRGGPVNRLKYLALAIAVAGISLTVSAPKANAQISVGINLGAAPACPYGYYDYAPYSCSPYGYYGPEWFSGGAFIGAGPWFHG